MRRLVVALFVLLIAGCAASKGNVVKIAITDNGFEPARVTVAKGQAVTIEFKRTAEFTCATEAVFKESGERVKLPLGETVRYTITPSASGTIAYACPMDMYKGEIVVQ